MSSTASYKERDHQMLLRDFKFLYFSLSSLWLGIKDLEICRIVDDCQGIHLLKSFYISKSDIITRYLNVF